MTYRLKSLILCSKNAHYPNLKIVSCFLIIFQHTLIVDFQKMNYLKVLTQLKKILNNHLKLNAMLVFFMIFLKLCICNYYLQIIENLSFLKNQSEIPEIPVEKQTLLLRIFWAKARHNPIREYNNGAVPPRNELKIYTLYVYL